MDDTFSTYLSVIFVWETKEANVAIVHVVVTGNCSAHAPAATPWTKPSDHLLLSIGTTGRVSDVMY